MSPAPDALARYADLLKHAPELFDANAMRAHALGFGNSATLERFAWDLEVLAQLEALSPDGALTLAGGGCSMLHLELEEQRVSVDLDVYFWTGSEVKSRNDWAKVVGALNQRFAGLEPGVLELRRSRSTEPPKVRLPMARYEVICPTTTGQIVLATREPGSRILVEVIFAPPPGTRTALGSRPMLPFRTGEHFGLDPLSLAASKLLALAVGEVGLPGRRIEELVKHVHDIVRLQSRYVSGVADIQSLRASLDTILKLENQWHKPKSTLRDCRTAIGVILPLLETTRLRSAIRDFENNNLRERLSDETWQLWPRLVRLLMSAAVGPHQPTEFIQARAASALLDTSLLEREQRLGLEQRLRARLESIDYGSGVVVRRLFPAPLFLELTYRGRLPAAVEVCRPVLGEAWPGFEIAAV